MSADQKSPLYKEQATHGTREFPLGFYEVTPADDWTGIKHHWHEEIEILYFEKGSGVMEINMEPFDVQENTFFFVNSGGLHSMNAKSPCTESAILFHPRMLSFDTYDTSQSRLLLPLQKGVLSFPRSLSPVHPAFMDIQEEYLKLVTVCRNYKHQLSSDISAQLFIKAGLLKILAILSSHSLLESATSANYREDMIKTVLSYIRSHYQERVYIQDMAGQINLNQQYFCRFFKETIGQSPISYLNEYRIRQALILLKSTDYSVTDISLSCGFPNFGNFSREFRRHTGTTPLKYRRTN